MIIASKKLLATTKMVTLIIVLVLVSVATLMAGTVSLPQTGQTTSYATGDNGSIRAGAAWPSPRFTAGANTVTDNLTGLMWTKDANLPGTGKTWQEALDYVASMNSGAGTYGYTDWRLPNINELESLVDSGRYLPALPSGHPFINVQSDYYWSSTSYAGATSLAWLVVINGGDVNADAKSSSFYVWPVRSGQAGTVSLPQTGQTTSYYAGDDGALQKGVAWPSPRFTAGANTVIDNLTGLMWAKGANLPGTVKTWQEALDYVAAMNTGAGTYGYTDWRLPNRKELFSLVNLATYNPSLPSGYPFTNVRFGYYWSSTSYASTTSSAWFVYMGDGIVVSGDKSGGSYVWPVRSGQVGSTEEQGPGGNDPNYDGNGDGVPDRLQGNVESFHAANSQYITVAVDPSVTISTISSVTTPDLGGLGLTTNNVSARLPVGTISFTLTGVQTGAVNQVKFYLPHGVVVNYVKKYGTSGWYDFGCNGNFSGIPCGEISGVRNNLVVTLYLIDNQLGDNDSTVGTIQDPVALLSPAQVTYTLPYLHTNPVNVTYCVISNMTADTSTVGVELTATAAGNMSGPTNDLISTMTTANKQINAYQTRMLTFNGKDISLDTNVIGSIPEVAPKSSLYGAYGASIVITSESTVDPVGLSCGSVPMACFQGDTLPKRNLVGYLCKSNNFGALGGTAMFTY
ncbi:MAG: DUF1566 domain-containing protein [Nitrospirae bacterium]|uniref:Lcl C-terminal domain-containing protein n=1 Tax=Candidatus Magnetobacterium casense TaxID=1455061 RepID=UPI0006961796|nr:DUF1566 domain-containing protein [Candidatus Magnetobacterium casensis]MBF0336488.1 DUF1566 domain-containing protein [Nitrospirota bacterium]